LPIEDIRSEYYLRILVDDKLGVMAKITSCLQDAGISIEAVIQKERVSQTVSIVILTDTALEADLNKALTAIESLDVVSGKINRIRVASLAK
jgi:homoserine dehydrogenase